MKPIMSVKEARKLLGKKYTSMTDEEVSELVEHTHKLAKLALDIARDIIAREKRDEEQARNTSKEASSRESNA